MSQAETVAIRVGLLGLGTVGSGVFDVLARNQAAISQRAGVPIVVTSVAVRDPNKTRSCSLDGIRLQSAEALVVDPDIDIVVELIGGETTACDLVLAAIESGKHVVTANKALIATHGQQIFAAAKTNQVAVLFEAAVAAGLPIIRILREGLSANVVQRVAGIINGTSNFILTDMHQQGSDFDATLAKAQVLGYAEAEPSFDIDGIDVAHKLTILAAIAFGGCLQYEKIATESLAGIASKDLAYAAELGYQVKYLGIAERCQNGLSLRVHPALVSDKQLLAHVNGVMNAVVIESDALGSSLYYGAGAGAEATASGVIADVIDIARMVHAKASRYVPFLNVAEQAEQQDPVVSLAEVHCPCYLRLQVDDEPGVMAEITRTLGEHAISIECLLQKNRCAEQRCAEIVLITHACRQAAVDQAMAALAALPSVSDTLVRIRVYE